VASAWTMPWAKVGRLMESPGLSELGFHSFIHPPTTFAHIYISLFIVHCSIPNSFTKKPRDSASTLLEYLFLHVARPRVHQTFSLSTVFSPWAVARGLLPGQGIEWARAPGRFATPGLKPLDDTSATSNEGPHLSTWNLHR
jgi:hypothetical protein